MLCLSLFEDTETEFYSSQVCSVYLIFLQCPLPGHIILLFDMKISVGISPSLIFKISARSTSQFKTFLKTCIFSLPLFIVKVDCFVKSSPALRCFPALCFQIFLEVLYFHLMFFSKYTFSAPFKSFQLISFIPLFDACNR